MVRLALIEKQLQYKLKEINFLSGQMPDEQVARQPFAKVPAFQHGDFVLYETAAICRYIDAAFPGPLLQPANARLLGRMAQIIGILDAYVSEPARMGFASELLVKPLMGIASDSDRAEQAASLIATAFEALSGCLLPSRFLVGDSITLADLHAVPLFDYIDATPGGVELIASQPRLHEWWSGIKNRQSVVDTRPVLSVFAAR